MPISSSPDVEYHRIRSDIRSRSCLANVARIEMMASLNMPQESRYGSVNNRKDGVLVSGYHLESPWIWANNPRGLDDSWPPRGASLAVRLPATLPATFAPDYVVSGQKKPCRIAEKPIGRGFAVCLISKSYPLLSTDRQLVTTEDLVAVAHGVRSL